jgi:peptide deformylase
MILPIKKYPDKVLRTSTEEVVFPLSQEMKKLTLDMMDTVRAADGIGLAAPQVGKSVKLVIINLEKSGLELFPLYNARVVKKGFKKVDIEEGCLSLPGIFGLVKRPKKITVEAQNMKGEKITFEDDGWVARVVQHELDHINGKLIIDVIKKYTQGEEIVKSWKKQKLL